MEKLGVRDRGQNTKPKPANSLEAVFAAFDRLLDKLHQESWLTRSRPAAHGFGGKTQELRFTSGRPKPAA